jgi:hypothetical protein
MEQMEEIQPEQVDLWILYLLKKQQLYHFNKGVV